MRKSDNPSRKGRQMSNKSTTLGHTTSKSRKGSADRDAEQKFREEAKQGRQRQRQHEADRDDHGGPQGQKDKGLPAEVLTCGRRSAPESDKYL